MESFIRRSSMSSCINEAPLLMVPEAGVWGPGLRRCLVFAGLSPYLSPLLTSINSQPDGDQWPGNNDNSASCPRV